MSTPEGELTELRTMLIPHAVEALTKEMSRSGLNRADVVNRAIIIYEHLAVYFDAGRLTVREIDGNYYQVKEVSGS